MKILIGRPSAYIEKLDVTGDVGEFYDALQAIIIKMGIKCDVVPVSTGGKRIYREKDTLFLAWHLHGTLPDIWHLKTGYLPDYFYFDKYGYSGWSELAHEYDYDVDMDSIRDEMQEFCDDYIANNRSRVVQPKKAYIPKKPYVLVLQQRTSDYVMDFAYLDNQQLLDGVTELYKDTEYTVCIKEHPLTDSKHGRIDTPITCSSDVFIATGSIHKIIAGASAVYTVNSGSGFEALLHGKRVFTSGHCDYHWVTDVLKTNEDLVRSKELIEQPVDTDSIMKFLHYTLNEYFVNIDDEDVIEQRILRAIEEYEDG